MRYYINIIIYDHARRFQGKYIRAIYGHGIHDVCVPVFSNSNSRPRDWRGLGHVQLLLACSGLSMAVAFLGMVDILPKTITYRRRPIRRPH